jgi:arylsulfatase A-like enzyme
MSAKKKQSGSGVSRRKFLQAAGAAGALLALGPGAARGKSRTAPGTAKQAGGKPVDGPYNILFILTDQERYFPAQTYPTGYSLPGREGLQKSGLTFANHHINAAVCTSSRSNIYTGQHIQHTKLFDNMDMPWQKSLGHDIPTLGDLLAKAGFHPAYLGKWHMSKALGTHNEYAIPQEKLTKNMESYGFKDYVGIGDVIGMTRGGYLNDDLIGAQAQRWLRLRGQAMSQKGQPWFLAVNLVNPHDVMFYDTDAPGQHVQDTPKPLMGIAREPDTTLYQQKWSFPLPPTRHQPFDAKGRPPAHLQYQLARGALVGNFPDQNARWWRLLNYYFNCIQQTDRVVQGVMAELDALGLTGNTIVVMTADHGELGGAHGTHGKGSTAYKEQNHVPLIISHPGQPQTHGQICPALTSHIDLAPTLIGWTGSQAPKQAGLTAKLRGVDLTPLLAKGAKAGVHDLRLATLYCFGMYIYLDAHFTREIQRYLNSGGDPKKLKQQGFSIDFKKRGAIRSVFDGRYKFSRYFSPRQFNQPQTLEEIFAKNDVELFDLQTNPDEMQNLANEPKKNGDLLLAMNRKLNAIIQREVGQDDGSFLPSEEAIQSSETFDP